MSRTIEKDLMVIKANMITAILQMVRLRLTDCSLLRAT